MKALLVMAATAVLIVSPALAQSAPDGWYQQPQAQDGDTGVYAGRKLIGRDPDSFIRNEMLRHYHSGYPDK